MSHLIQKLSAYAAYHQSKWIKVSHLLGVPLICVSVFMLCIWLTPLSLSRYSISLAWCAYLILIGYYLLLDVVLGVISGIALIPLLIIAQRLAGTHVTLTGLVVFAALFVGGWVLQLLGHYHEGNRPALLDNLEHILVAPLFLITEALMSVGAMSHLKQQLQQSLKHRLHDKT